MGDLLLAAPLVLAAYLVGCFSTGYYLGRWTSGSDVRASGSGSSGARNVARTLGPAGAALTLLGDLGKGALVAWGAGLLGYDEWAVAAAMVAVVAGHVWPAQLRFRGGKGVATATGCALVYDLRTVLAAAVVFVVLFVILRRFTLCGLLAIAAAPLLAFAIGRPSAVYFGLAAVVFLVLAAHRTNLRDIYYSLQPSRRRRAAS